MASEVSEVGMSRNNRFLMRLGQRRVDLTTTLLKALSTGSTEDVGRG